MLEYRITSVEPYVIPESLIRSLHAQQVREVGEHALSCGGIPVGGVPVKYETRQGIGHSLCGPFFYPRPCSIPATPVSSHMVISRRRSLRVIAPVPVVPGAVIRCRPVGALPMQDAGVGGLHRN